MSQIQTTISNLIASQFPSVYQTEGTNLIAFIEAYYEWMEQQGNALNRSRNLLSYSDIDTTLEEFIIYFKNTYLAGIQFNTLSDKRLTVKKIIDLYRSKGNERALKLLFQLVFNEDIDVYLPGNDIFKTSDGVWIKPIYLEVSATSRNREFLGKKITGVNSRATAFVDHIVRRKVNSKFIDLFYITDLSKDFQTGEQLDWNGNLTNVPVVVGSLSDLLIDEAGYGFSIGDLVNLTSSNGKMGVGRVTAINEVTGAVKFTLNDIPSGWGYSVNSSILISNTVVSFSNVQLANTSNPFINEFDRVTLYNTNAASYTVAGANVSGTVRMQASGNNWIIANTGTPNFTTTFANGDYVKIFANSSTSQIKQVTNVANSTVLVLASNTAYANGISKIAKMVSSNVTANAISFASNNVGLTTLSGSLSNNYTKLYVPNGNATITLISTGIDANIALGTIGGTETVVLFTDYIADNNANTVPTPYLSIPLNSTSFKFPKKPAANVSSDSLIRILQYSIPTLGEVDSITTLNPGKNYNVAPYVKIYERGVASKKLQDYIITIDTLTGIFREGEIVRSTVPLQGNIVSITTDHYANTFSYYELIYQSNGTANTATGGIINLSGNTIQINVFSGTFVTSNTVNGLNSSGVGNTSAVTLSGLTGLAIGRVKAANTTGMTVKRLSYKNDFRVNSNIVGELSGASANVTSVQADTTSAFAGENANVTSQVFAANGAVKTLDVQDSGFGYVNDELVTFTSIDGTKTGTARVSLGKQGTNEGYYASTRGFTSADKYIQDGTYYQNFSYEIRASLDLTRYSDMVKEVVHVAGTKLFGAVVKKSTITPNPGINNYGSGPSIG